MNFLTNNGIKFTEDDILYILRKCDLDRDGEINID